MIKEEYINKIRSDKQLRTKIMLICNVSLATVYRWLNANASDLSTVEVLRVICDHFKVKQSEIIEPVKRLTL